VLGWARTAAVYGVASTLGGALIVLRDAHSESPQVLVGASGGVMGLVGAALAIHLHRHQRLRSTAAAQRLRQVLIVIALQTWIDFVTPQISMFAHLAGVFLGFLSAWLMTARSKAGEV
jgi:rhomboid protease GluP